MSDLSSDESDSDDEPLIKKKKSGPPDVSVAELITMFVLYFLVVSLSLYKL